MKRKMKTKRFRVGVAISFMIQFIVKYPKFVIFPIIAHILLGSVNYFMTYHVPLFSSVSRVDGFSKLNDYASVAISLRSLYDLIYFLLSMLLSFIILAGYLKIVKKYNEQKTKPEWSDFFSWNFSLFGQYIALSVILALLYGSGFALLVIPGLILLTKYFFAFFVLIDKNPGISISLKNSHKLVTGIRGRLLCLLIPYIVFILAPSFLLAYNYYPQKNTALLPYIYMMVLLYSIITTISVVVLSYLYFDLSSQEDYNAPQKLE